MKAISFTEHAKLQMLLRGAHENEVIKVINSGNWEKAKHGKLHSSLEFEFNSLSSINSKYYKHKQLDVIFVDEPDKIVIITVKVYYYN